MEKKLKALVEIEITPGIVDNKRIEHAGSVVMDAVHYGLNRYAVKYDDTIFCGSFAKNTHLCGSDLDIFILLPHFYREFEFKTLLLPAIAFGLQDRGLEYDTKYASHPYVTTKVHSPDGPIIEVDIVPCYSISKGEPIRSAVDRTPMHTKYVQHTLRANQLGDVRLLKQFLKANGFYGASGDVKGFTGYLCELLIILYGTIDNLFESELSSLRCENGGLLVPDPVDPKRNVASVLKPQILNEFIEAIRAFEKKDFNGQYRMFKPNIDLPVHGAVIQNRINKRGTCIMFLKKPVEPDQNPDTEFDKFVREVNIALNNATNEGFKLLRKRFYGDLESSSCVAEFSDNHIPALKYVIGPPVEMKEACEKFREKHEKVLVEGNRLIAEEYREKTMIGNYLPYNTGNSNTEYYEAVENFLRR